MQCYYRSNYFSEFIFIFKTYTGNEPMYILDLATFESKA